MKYAKAGNTDWRTALEAAGFPGKGSITIAAPNGERAFLNYESISNEFGQRIDTHNFPIMGDYWAQPLSREVNQFNISGWIIGDDYLKQRDQLSAVLHSPHDSDTPLTLELPNYEPLPVLFRSGSYSERGRAQGMVDIRIRFERVLRPAPTLQILDTTVVVLDAQNAAIAAAGAEQDSFVDRAAAGFKAAAKELTGLISGAQQGIRLLESTASEIQQTTQEILRDIDQGLQTPGKLLSLMSSTVLGAVQGIAQLPENAEREGRKLLQTFMSWANYTFDAKPVTSAQAREQMAVSNGMKVLGAIGTSELLPQLKPYSLSDARALYRAIDLIAESLELPGAEQLEALETLRLALREELRDKGWFELASERRTEIWKPLPSIALAHELGSEEPLLRRMNRPANTWFMGGELLYV